MMGIGESIGSAIFENLGRAAGRVQENKPLPSDLLESDDAYLVVFDAPGATASDLQVRYVDDRVEVRLDRFREFYDDYEMTYPGRGLALDGSVTLPEDAVVDAGAASATLKGDGTLHVEIPKAEAHEADEPVDEQTAHEASDDADTAADAETDDESTEE
ncbi:MULTISPECIES: Hsp20/alpha crystallin family protein [Haloarcula]|uniref:Hsp20/alpha crystallin family protein n=1 Tax=Haloarcula TaxID=2237 RepID=UPI0023E790F7|nr:Hsp20/alpha crystallin family protein [Halomicroarcula sp. SHR3]